MARRPRPAHRPTLLPTPRNEMSKAQVVKQPRPKAIDFLSESESADPVDITMQEAHSEDESDFQATDVDPEDFDAPRIAQWVDDEQFEPQAHSDDQGSSSASDGQESDDDDDDDRSTSRAGPSRRLRSLEDDLSTLPLGTLRNAQRSLARTHAPADSESSSDDDQSQSDDDDDTVERETGRLSRPKNDLAKRANKHAPTEVTSKRPVSRRRVVVDDQLPKPRDPRFMHSAGRYDASKFKQQYDFLSGMHEDELSTLRDHVKRARKLVVNSPSHLRAEREEELNRLDRAMKKAESAVHADNRERVESEALRAAKQTEKEKRRQGKAGWWMKQSEKKELLAKARLDAIAAVGGKQAVKKAVEKKQKKVSQKEKKMRPFPRSEAGKRRRSAGPIDSRGTKRRKVG